MDIVEAQKLIAIKCKESYETPLADFIYFIKSVYYAVGLHKNMDKSLRASLILNYRKRHIESIINAIESGIDICKDVLRDYPNLQKIYNERGK